MTLVGQQPTTTMALTALCPVAGLRSHCSRPVGRPLRCCLRRCSCSPSCPLPSGQRLLDQGTSGYRAPACVPGSLAQSSLQGTEKKQVLSGCSLPPQAPLLGRGGGSGSRALLPESAAVLIRGVWEVVKMAGVCSLESPHFTGCSVAWFQWKKHTQSGLNLTDTH